MNTPQKGQVRYITFKEKDIWYAVGLELNIVVTGEEENIALLNLFDAMTGYIETASKIKGSRDYFALNQTPELEYQIMWDNRDLKTKGRKNIKSPFVHSYGVKGLAV